MERIHKSDANHLIYQSCILSTYGYPKQVGEATLASRESTLNARMREAEEDKDGTGTEGTVDPGEIYSATREWTSDGFQQADAELKGMKGAGKQKANCIKFCSVAAMPRCQSFFADVCTYVYHLPFPCAAVKKVHSVFSSPSWSDRLVPDLLDRGGLAANLTVVPSIAYNMCYPHGATHLGPMTCRIKRLGRETGGGAANSSARPKA